VDGGLGRCLPRGKQMLRLRQFAGIVFFTAFTWIVLLALHAIPELMLYMITGRN
jgi:hypothetical protein